MSDIRLIVFDQDTKEVKITADFMHLKMSPLEEAIQRVIIAIMTTAGTMVDASGWGGSAMLLINQLRKANIKDTEKEVTRMLDSALASLLDSEPDVDFRVIDLTLSSLERHGRGYSISISLDFANAVSERILINE